MSKEIPELEVRKIDQGALAEFDLPRYKGNILYPLERATPEDSYLGMSNMASDIVNALMFEDISGNYKAEVFHESEDPEKCEELRSRIYDR